MIRCVVSQIRRTIRIVILCVPLCAGPAHAEEQIQFVVPDGYGIVYNVRPEGRQIVEWIPEGETLETWRDMLTLQIYFDGLDVTPREFADGYAEGMKKNCKPAELTTIAEGEEDGYPFIFFWTVCDPKDEGETREVIALKMMEGDGSSYIVLKSWRYQPDDAAIMNWSHFMASVRICDTGSPEAPCS